MHAEEQAIGTEAYKRRCMIRWLLARRAERGDEWLRNYVSQMPAWASMGEDFNAQWRLGNRGAHGDWRAP